MEEVTIRNKREDLDVYYEYLLTTENGKQIGKKVLIARLWFVFFVTALIFIFIWGTLGYFGISIRFSIVLVPVFIFALIVAAFFGLVITGFKPYYFIGKQILKKREKSLTEKDLQLFQLPKTINIETDWLKVQYSEAIHQWHWGLVDSIGLTTDFIFLSVGNCCVYYIPKRDFASQEDFLSFGQKLNDLAKKNKDQPLATELVS